MGGRLDYVERLLVVGFWESEAFPTGQTSHYQKTFRGTCVAHK